MIRLTSKKFKEIIWDYENNIINAKFPVAIKFFIENCSDCEILNPIFLKYEKDNPEVSCFEMKAESDEFINNKLDLDIMPVVVIFKSPNVFEKIEGAMPLTVLTKRINYFLETISE